ncbi:adenylate/guanylate cyclase domain-containing protein [Sinorhizobium medicae]|uniref:adenylate/guanylate cyclase domain-containing protein n=1 Tax=Sinorhizobium medicae TaxID=110321 RepID=UPI000406FDED|nr:adenylate/guanylate cyclase domain-containing protein [Sinorhizobium medicae]MBO1941403.1 adenylate/guanylate cyclase domain-containing protein [Sinorhizobium medicae]MDX0432787.1 adenylate/guanylate cyclase domain-containing protein [Sinorhizobium medicae]MDX0445377.1 adenylate/guanylate cyclase domain-containing protein [Sinorhizobium medicae]MDX0463618.1 adenylate/guanylate cyclase domain-containing protein [Sinorhizobium medicae]MDX0487650.1 adenylate/guanylate cyclase domain-containing
MEQRLAAVLAADMAGYSRLMEADEAGTLARLRTHRIELIDPAIEKNKGHLIKTTGDGMLVEFQSVTDAVKCAVEIQSRMKRRNADVAQDRRIEFRIGINLGDIIFEDDDIFGDGVNIAARIEQLADVGGICVTAAVAMQVADRLEVSIEDLGEKMLKNISRPIHLFRVALEGTLPVFPETADARRSVSKPAIVVLPFDNMSGDPDQEFFADGLTEDIITELSRRHELFVISRNSSFVYKNQPVNVREVAEKLGAQYLVEGSVRKIGDRVRVTVQLIDAVNDAHIWADKYDRRLDDIFAIQDEVTSAIAATLPGRVEAAQRDLLARTKPANMAAYECALAAKVLHHRSTVADNRQARALIDRAVALDPGYAHAHAWRACILGQAWVHGWCDDKDAAWAEIVSELDRALALDDNDADVHRILAAVNVNNNALTTARYHQERALSLNPNYDLVVVQQGELLMWLGRPEEGIEWIRKAMQLNPHHPERFWSHLGKACFSARQYGESIEAFMHLSVMDHAQHAFVAACYGCLGDDIAAQAHMAKVRALAPEFDIDAFLATQHYVQESDLQRLRNGLVKAGAGSGSVASEIAAQ